MPTHPFVGNPLAPHEDPSRRSRHCFSCGHDDLQLNDANELICERCGVQQGRGLGSEEREYRCFGENHAEDEAKKRADRDDRYEKHAEATEGLNKVARDRFHQAKAFLADLYAEHPASGVAALTFDELTLATARARVASEELGRRTAAAREAGEPDPLWAGSPIFWAITLARDACARRTNDPATWTVPEEWMVGAWDEDTLWAGFSGAKSERFRTNERVGNATGVSSRHRDAARAVEAESARRRRVDDLGQHAADRVAKTRYLDALLVACRVPGLHAFVLERKPPTHRPVVFKVLGRRARVLAAHGMQPHAVPGMTPVPPFAASGVTLPLDGCSPASARRASPPRALAAQALAGAAPADALGAASVAPSQPSLRSPRAASPAGARAQRASDDDELDFSNLEAELESALGTEAAAEANPDPSQVDVEMGEAEEAAEDGEEEAAEDGEEAEDEEEDEWVWGSDVATEDEEAAAPAVAPLSAGLAAADAAFLATLDLTEETPARLAPAARRTAPKAGSLRAFLLSAHARRPADFSRRHADRKEAARRSEIARAKAEDEERARAEREAEREAAREAARRAREAEVAANAAARAFEAEVREGGKVETAKAHGGCVALAATPGKIHIVRYVKPIKIGRAALEAAEWLDAAVRAAEDPLSAVRLRLRGAPTLRKVVEKRGGGRARQQVEEAPLAYRCVRIAMRGQRTKVVSK